MFNNNFFTKTNLLHQRTALAPKRYRGGGGLLAAIKNLPAAFAVIAAATTLLFAEAYQVNTLSTKQLGMGHTGAGQSSIGVEGMHFNPGGLGFIDSKIEASAGITFIMPSVEIGDDYKAKRGVSTPLYLYAGSNVGKFSYGLSVTSPYGNSAEWDKNWAGAELLQDISLKVFAFQPTAAYNILDRVSVGAGLTINTGSFSQSKALVAPGKLDGYSGLAAAMAGMGQAPNAAAVNNIIDKYADESAVSATLSGDADTKVGFNVGVMAKVVPELISVGIAYRSGVKAKVSKGETEINYANDKTKEEITQLNTIIGAADPSGNAIPRVNIPPLDKGTFTAELPLPANLNVGLSITPKENLLFNLDLQWVNWKAYDSLVLQFSQEAGNLKLSSAKKYENSIAIRFGTQIGILDDFDLRAGVYFDQSPVLDNYLNPETPSADKAAGTLGCSYRPIPRLSIDAALLYVRSLRTRTIDASKNENNFGGAYKVQAFAPAIGLTFKL